MNDGKLELCIYSRLNFQSTHTDQRTKQCIGEIYELMYGIQMRTSYSKYHIWSRSTFYTHIHTHADDDTSEKRKKNVPRRMKYIFSIAAARKKSKKNISKTTHENAKWWKIDFIFAKIAVGIGCESIGDMKHVEDLKREFNKFRYFPLAYKSMNKRYGDRRWIQYTIKLKLALFHFMPYWRLATKWKENCPFGYSKPKMGIIGYRKEIGC